MTRPEVRLARVVDAPVEVAYDSWNSADARTRWHKLGDPWTVEALTDLRVGGPWRVAFGPSPDGLTVEEGIHEVVDRPHLVTYTCTHRLPGLTPFETRITITFRAQGQKTLVTLVESGFPDEGRRRHFEDGWAAHLESDAASAAA